MLIIPAAGRQLAGRYCLLAFERIADLDVGRSRAVSRGRQKLAVRPALLGSHARSRRAMTTLGIFRRHYQRGATGTIIYRQFP